MPEPSSTFQSVTPLPPRVVSIHNNIFEAPDETGLSVSVPTDYKFYTSSSAPATPLGTNGDWYMFVSSATIKTYRKVVNNWTLVSTITGGGGGGGDISGVNITDCVFDSGDITNSVISTSTIVSPVVSGGTFATPVITTPVITGGVITGAIVTGLSTPAAASDAATKQYVDGVAQGLSIHEQCRVATTGSNVTLAGGAPNTLDGISLLATNRILVKDQSNPIQNGIYTVTTLGSGANGTWTRATDADSGHELDSAYTLVTNGTANGGTSWVVSGAPAIGSDPINWTRFFAVTSIPASIITGTIVAGQIGSINAGSIIGTISAGQINSINANQITGSITASQIGSVNATTISGTITSSQIGSVNATVIAGVISAGQIGSVTASTIIGVITTNQLADQILNTQRLLASSLSVVRRLSSLPALPNTDYPVGALVLNTTNKILYQNVSNVWTTVTASSNVVGTLTADDIASINASSIVGLIIANQISSVSATTITGQIVSSQISSVSATVIQGGISASQITTVNASSIQGGISSSQITSVNASSITGSITSSQIASVNASTITLGSLSAINYTVGSGLNQTTINGSGLSVGNLVINGVSNVNTITISGTYTTTISGGNLAAVGIATGGASVSMDINGTDGRLTSAHGLLLRAASATSIECTSGGLIKLAGINYTHNGGVYAGNQISLGWDAGNSRIGIFVDGSLKVLLNQNV